ncbi:hypothetical protein BC829DRAFT_382845 [Chytridium lagenaria]|nr:hypothetical protein BC829DRAFT_382845 [Chytridium lagenaria]
MSNSSVTDAHFALPPVPTDLFVGIVYYINPLLGLTRRTQLKSLLSVGGGQEAPSIDENICPRFELKTTTHVITHEIDFPEHNILDKETTAVVTPDWVYNAVKSGKLPPKAFFSANPDKFFSGLIVTCTEEIVRNDQVILYAGLEAFGGQYRFEFTDEITHLVALSPSSPIYTKALERGVNIILPHFLDDCIRIRRLIDPKSTESPFDLTISSSKPPQMKPAEKLFLKDKGLYVDPKVVSTFADGVFSSVKAKIEEAGGTVYQKYDKLTVDAVILANRQSRLYVQAENDGKFVASVRWLKDTLDTGLFRSPRLKALHYPPPEVIPEFKSFVVCISNYSGRAREDIETMVTHLGGEFTRNMTPNNTHLICAKPFSEKYAKAIEWDIIVANHLWLEETYVLHKVQQPSRLSYQYYPSCLPLIVGEVFVPEEEIERSLRLASVPDKIINVSSQPLPPKVSPLASNPAPPPKLPTKYTKKRIAKMPSKVAPVKTYSNAGSLKSAAKDPEVVTVDGSNSTPPSRSNVEARTPKSDNVVIVLDDEEVEDVAKQALKVSVSVITTGVKLDKIQLKGLSTLGGQEAKDVPNCTHLIANKIARTEKFLLLAILTRKEILSVEWLNKSKAISTNILNLTN